jgi:hypothetical protein
MVIIRPIEREALQVFFQGKALARSCHDLPLGDSSRQIWRSVNADTHVEPDGLWLRCLPYSQGGHIEHL